MGTQEASLELTDLRLFPAKPPAPASAFADSPRLVPVVSLQRGDYRLTYHLNPDDSYTITLQRKQTLLWGNRLTTVDQFESLLKEIDKSSPYADDLNKIKEYVHEILKPLASKSFFGDAWNNPALSFKKLKIASLLYKLLTDDEVEDKRKLIGEFFEKAAELQGEQFGEHTYPQGKLGSIIFNLRKRIDPEFKELHHNDVKKLLNSIEKAVL